MRIWCMCEKEIPFCNKKGIFHLKKAIQYDII